MFFFSAQMVAYVMFVGKQLLGALPPPSELECGFVYSCRCLNEFGVFSWSGKLCSLWSLKTLLGFRKSCSVSPALPIMKRLGVYTNLLTSADFFITTERLGIIHLMTALDEESQTTWLVNSTEANWMHQTLTKRLVRARVWRVNKQTWMTDGWMLHLFAQPSAPMGLDQVVEEKTWVVWTLHTAEWVVSEWIKYLLVMLVHAKTRLCWLHTS